MDEVDHRFPGPIGISSEELQHRFGRNERGQRTVLREGAEAAPTPLDRILAQAGSHRIQCQVRDELEEMRIAFDQDRVEATLEEVARDRVPHVEPLRELAVQALHAGGKVSVRSLHNQVVVIGEKAVQEAVPSEPRRDRAEELQKERAVLVVEVDRLAPVAAGVDVVDPVWDENAKRARHHTIVNQRHGGTRDRLSLVPNTPAFQDTTGSDPDTAGLGRAQEDVALTLVDAPVRSG